jgi:hypothetical protein
MSAADPSESDLFDVVTAPTSVEQGEGTVTVELGPDAAAFAALATRLDLPPAALWRAAWALTLARLAGTSRVRVGRDGAVAVIDVPPEGELLPWLVAVAAAGAPASPAEGASAGAGAPKPTNGHTRGHAAWRGGPAQSRP